LLHSSLLCLCGTAGIGETGGGSSHELVDEQVKFFGRGGGVEIDFLVAVLGAALEGFILAGTAYDAEGKHFQKGEKAKIAEKAEILLPGSPFGENREGSVKNRLRLEEFVGSHGDQFVVGGEVVHEVDHVAFEVVGIAEKYEFHFYS